MYRSWIGAMAGVEVCPVQLPGRWERLREPAFTRMEPLVDALAPVLIEHAGVGPFAFYGHSLGGLVAFELARRLAASGPRRLLVSGRAAPQLPPSLPPIHALDEKQFLAAVAERYEPLPQVILEDRDSLELFMRTLRLDLELYESYRHVPGSPLSIPIAAFAGAADAVARAASMTGWQEQTAGSFSVREFPGKHFFIRDSEKELLRVIAEQL
jgi:medium-chain acyl-[acyl-carrier-protein] hydrolase